MDYYNVTDVSLLGDSVAFILTWIIVGLSAVMYGIFFSAGKNDMGMGEGAYRVFSALLVVVSIVELLLFFAGESAWWFLHDVNEAPTVGGVGSWLQSTGIALVGYVVILAVTFVQFLCVSCAIASVLERAGLDYDFKRWQWLLIVVAFLLLNPLSSLALLILLWRKNGFLTAVRYLAFILVTFAAMAFLIVLSMQAVGNILFVLIVAIPFYAMIMSDKGGERVVEEGSNRLCKTCYYWAPDTTGANRLHYCRMGNRQIDELTKMGHCIHRS